MTTTVEAGLLERNSNSFLRSDFCFYTSLYTVMRNILNNIYVVSELLLSARGTVVVFVTHLVGTHGIYIVIINVSTSK